MKYIVMLLILTFLFFSTSISDYREIKDLIIITGLVIDKKNDDFIIYLETSASSTGGTSTDTQTSEEPSVINATGKTIFDAFDSISKMNCGITYLNHCRVLIFSERVSKEGIKDILLSLLKDYKSETNMNVFISSNEDISKILEYRDINHMSLSNVLESAIKDTHHINISSKSNIYKLYNTIITHNNNIIVPIINTTDKNKKFKLNTIAVFKEDKIIGYLDEYESLSYLFLSDDMNGSGNVTYKNSSGNYETVSIKNTKCTTNCKIIDEKLYFTFNIECSFDTLTSYYKDYNEKQKIENDIKSYIENGCTKTINKIQKEYKVDNLRIMDTFYKKYPKQFKDLKEDIMKVFEEVQINTNVSVNIYNTSFLQR